MLLDVGADVNAKDSRSPTPLMLAVARTNQGAAVIRLLLDKGQTYRSRAGPAKALTGRVRG